MNIKECSEMGYKNLYSDETIVMYKRFESGSMNLIAFHDIKDNNPTLFRLSENQTYYLKRVLNGLEE